MIRNRMAEDKHRAVTDKLYKLFVCTVKLIHRSNVTWQLILTNPSTMSLHISVEWHCNRFCSLWWCINITVHGTKFNRQIADIESFLSHKIRTTVNCHLLSNSLSNPVSITYVIYCMDGFQANSSMTGFLYFISQHQFFFRTISEGYVKLREIMPVMLLAGLKFKYFLATLHIKQYFIYIWRRPALEHIFFKRLKRIAFYEINKRTVTSRLSRTVKLTC